MSQEIYLDNSATTQVLPEVAEKMLELMLKNYGNPSSLHRLGFEAEKELKKARAILGKILNADPSTIYFCSSGTEANNWAIKKIAQRYKKRGNHLITTSIEHPSVLNSFRELEEEGFDVSYLPVDSYGNISIDDFTKVLRKETILVSMMHVNNEVGTELPIAEVGQALKNTQVIFHVDGVQSFCKLELDPGKMGIDLLSISGHKIHGPKGIGALYVNKKVHLPPLFVGGGQEVGKRSGTENVPGIAGFAAAAEIIDKNKGYTHTLALKRSLLQYLKEIPGAHFNGAPEDSNSPIINIWFEGVDKAEVLLHMCGEEGLYFATGSACHSKHPDPSHVLQGIGAKGDSLYGAIRLSLGYLNQEEQMKKASAILAKKVEELREITR